MSLRIFLNRLGWLFLIKMKQNETKELLSKKKQKQKQTSMTFI